MKQESIAIAAIAQRYRDEGYDVVVEPRGDCVHPFLAGFTPDLIATRGIEGVVVEIKTNRIDLSSNPLLTRLAEAVNAQLGWRLDVIVLEEETAIEKVVQKAVEPSDE